MNKFLALLFFVLLLSCKEKTVNISKDITFDKQMDVSYGNDSEQKLDLYIPKNTQQNKDLFIIIHGGGWKGGNKSQLTYFTLSMMEKFPQCIFANINYRLASENRFGIPNQTDDIDNVILFLEKTLKYKPNIILLGNSAGGHLSMLYSYKFDANKRVKAVVNIVGPADLSDPSFKNYYDYSFVENHLVDPTILSKGISIENFASPVYWITKNAPPTISFYGNNDTVIPLSQKKILDAALNKNGIFNQSFEFPGGHLDWANEKNAPFVIHSISEFLMHTDKK
ncbi:alpha/beta hydrolase [Chryseobacterium indoltheticum]|uniref:Alpha/beta hydrolase n=1 Tax=Chryseobacterium indoltheticum TaxID=254 RepID=A0A3G6N1T9_9FLAO|nr:alpha/beta hydrolase [Chryseobacterium indoltheticum]AZA61437.1 alpha/beta hydrolase [Chryseobacterium indoltheticum]